MKPLVLMILDGWGIAPPSSSNAVTTAATPNLDRYFKEYSHCVLSASGEAVGLPAGQMGNSEVGHLNIGAGRIVYQDLARITKSIENRSFFENNVLKECMQKAKGHALHLLGLVSDGGVHSHIEHLKALVKMAQREGLEEVYVHAFLDGRDVPPKSAMQYIKGLENGFIANGFGKIATVCGRYYGMDRDKNWNRTEKAYNAMVKGDAPEFISAAVGIKSAYGQNVTDEFVEPFKIMGVDGKIQPDDGVIFFNFRPDRARQITQKLLETQKNFVCMTEYQADFKVPVAFPKEKLKDTLGEVLAAEGLNQLRIAETEKYAHVTFFFNGGREEPNQNEERILIPSPKVATYDLQPEMSAVQVTDTLLEELAKDKYEVIIVNFANPDMVGHTGNMDAAVKAVETVDTCVGRIVDAVMAKKGCVCITADHGNAEQMVGKQGVTYTAHTSNPVPFILVHRIKYKLHDGILADIAPTMLVLLGIVKPISMTGIGLIDV
ncbi:MAG: 2,3-bisphosphoglycerate-independent phosphoglycerate mutase [Phascolarctobacterium sp.]|nr:2,3-bisphosphoglycerate-independent phosphoglycerate mutase [Candidatus Phascolarctobacterium caballi]